MVVGGIFPLKFTISEKRKENKRQMNGLRNAMVIYRILVICFRPVTVSMLRLREMKSSFNLKCRQKMENFINPYYVSWYCQRNELESQMIIFIIIK